MLTVNVWILITCFVSSTKTKPATLAITTPDCTHMRIKKNDDRYIIL